MGVALRTEAPAAPRRRDSETALLVCLSPPAPPPPVPSPQPWLGIGPRLQPHDPMEQGARLDSPSPRQKEATSLPPLVGRAGRKEWSRWGLEVGSGYGASVRSCPLHSRARGSAGAQVLQPGRGFPGSF